MSSAKEAFQSPVAGRKRAAVSSPLPVKFNTPNYQINSSSAKILRKGGESSSSTAGLFSPAPSSGASKRSKLPGAVFQHASPAGAPSSATKTDTETIKTPDNVNIRSSTRVKGGAAAAAAAKKKLNSLIKPMSPSHIAKEPNEVCIEIVDSNGCREGLNNLSCDWNVQQLVESVVLKRAYAEGDYYLYDYVNNCRILGSVSVGDLDVKISYKLCV